ncbi:CHRD domain-containing protein [Streptomyces sp. NPDC057302]|uniref:CHRD domain-containing protein n=1 Tax=Streptomyces sp. NPDC057302 TaxID=3346094 RepID=UPI003641AB42
MGTLGISGSSGTFARRRRAMLAAGVAVAAAGGVAIGAPSAVAHGGSDGSGGSGSVFAASMNGANEVPVRGGPAVGDKDGQALEFVEVKGDKVSVTVKWRGTGKPTALHIHQGAKGTNGGVKIDFTKLLEKGEGKGQNKNKNKGKNEGKSHRVTGTVKVDDAALLDQLKADPNSFYANLHTAEFPGGAVRGQLHKVTTGIDLRAAAASFQASVTQGKQIYECKKAEDGSGTFAFAQRDVRARLGGGIAHDFVAPNSGTPRWTAPDGSQVTGKLISRTPNGDKNIPELDLAATRTGKPRGLLAGTAEILRLNTVGGVAPAGDCKAGAIAKVPYKADYVFVQR